MDNHNIAWVINDDSVVCQNCCNYDDVLTYNYSYPEFTITTYLFDQTTLTYGYPYVRGFINHTHSLRVNTANTDYPPFDAIKWLKAGDDVSFFIELEGQIAMKLKICCD